jgi:holliday junction DNA helicase RuvA
MIGYLRGKIIDVRRNELWLDVNGVGYRVKVVSGQWSVVSEIEIFVHTAVREDAITLYGFLTMEELALFEMLIEVSGVGPKTAIEIVGAAKSEEIEAAIAQADVNFFSRIKGIGKKSAQRIIIDLKNKIGSLKEVDLAAEDEDSAVFMALKQFGFKSGEIQAVMKKVDQDLTEQEQVKLGLKMLGKTRV